MYGIHVSDVRTFKSCRQKWEWSSPLRRYLESNVTPIYFIVGRAVHFALAQFYENGEEPVDVYDRFINDVRKQEEPFWILPEIKTTYEKNFTLGRGMLVNYMDWVHSLYGPDDEWKILATEQPYETPLFNISGNRSNKVFLVGRFDQVIESKMDGTLWLREFKTSSRSPDADWLDFDDQVTSYSWGVQQVLNRPLAGIQYRFLLKRIPEDPSLVYNGKQLSKAINSKLHTTKALYLAAIKKYGFKVADYADILQDLDSRGWYEYFIDIPVTRSQEQLNIAAQNLWRVSLEMLRRDTRIYPAPEWNKCKFCHFREPCYAKQAGAPYEPILSELYHRRVEEVAPDVEYEGGSDG